MLKLTLCLLATSVVCIFSSYCLSSMWKIFKSLICLRDFERNCFPGLANIWLSVEYFRMLLLVFVETLPLFINEQEFGGVQVRAGLFFGVAPRVGKTRLFSCAARAISTFSYFRVIWEQNLECSDPSAQAIVLRNAGVLFDLWIIRSILCHLKLHNFRNVEWDHFVTSSSA